METEYDSVHVVGTWQLLSRLVLRLCARCTPSISYILARRIAYNASAMMKILIFDEICYQDKQRDKVRVLLYIYVQFFTLKPYQVFD